MAAQPLNRTFASIDLGSHTVRLLIGKFEGEKTIAPVRAERRITRLAGGFGADETLKEDGIRRSIAAMSEYAELLHRHKVPSVTCGATGVVRRAGNSMSFIESIEKKTGIHPIVLSEDAEAFLSAKGTLSVLPPPEGLILSFDLGGSSTEFLLVDGSHPDSPLFGTSVCIGSATITERFFREDPPRREAVAAAADYAMNSIAPVISAVQPFLSGSEYSHRFQLAGTAGTMTTLAAMYLGMEPYEPCRVNGLVLPESWLSRTVESLSATPLAARRDIRGLEKGREDIILGGAIIAGQILKGFRPDRLVVADGGLLEGLLLDLVEKQCGVGPSLLSPLTWRL